MVIVSFVLAPDMVPDEANKALQLVPVKTKLISRLVDHFQLPEHSNESCSYSDATKSPQGSTLKTGLAFFYCLRSVDERRIPENILASVVKQLATQDDLSFSALLRIYSKKEERGFLSTRLTIAECQGLIQDMSACFSRVIVILGALDECHEETRDELITAFNTLLDSGISIKILISSRPDPDIRAELGDKANRSISATDNAGDIMEYTRERLRKFQMSKKAVRHVKGGAPLIPAYLEERIVSTIQNKSEGM
jgi:hypothetical protein